MDRYRFWQFSLASALIGLTLVAGIFSMVDTAGADLSLAFFGIFFLALMGLIDRMIQLRASQPTVVMRYRTNADAGMCESLLGANGFHATVIHDTDPAFGLPDGTYCVVVPPEEYGRAVDFLSRMRRGAKADVEPQDGQSGAK